MYFMTFGESQNFETKLINKLSSTRIKDYTDKK